MIITLCVLTLINLVMTGVAFYALRTRLVLLQDDVSAIRIRMVPVAVGGRLAPSFADLQAAKNRMDAQGVAHPGGSG